MNFSEHGFIEKIEFEYPDVHLIHLTDGRVVGISKDCIVLYENIDAFYDCATNDLPTIHL
jgi:hypothetical protein